MSVEDLEVRTIKLVTIFDWLGTADTVFCLTLQLVEVSLLTKETLT
jgi:hypothetical protein